MTSPVNGRVTSHDDRISVIGEIDFGNFRRVLAAIHDLTQRQGHRSFILDFSRCRKVVTGAMAAIVTQSVRLRTLGIEGSLIPPTDLKLRNLFSNTGWAHYLDPAHFEVALFRAYSHVPLSGFGTPTEQGQLVNRVMDTLLKSATEFGREDFAAVEWTTNEIMDNVLVHSDSPIGGFVHLNNYVDRRRVDIVVADAGRGIPRSLREGFPALRSDSDALELAIRQGVTRNASLGQGNGLYGSYRVAEASRGSFHVHSGHASLEAVQGQLDLKSESIPLNGTLVVASVDYSERDTLATALSFGSDFRLSDFIELQYEMDPEGVASLDMAKETTSFGSREAGRPIRTKIMNLCRLGRDIRQITVDLSSVPLLSSSFADEVFGKLFVELGPMQFMQRIQIRGANVNVQSLVDRAILQRSRQDP